MGNQALQHLLQSGGLQAKLDVSRPGDVHEREADAIAAEVLTMPQPIVPAEPLSATPAGGGFVHRATEEPDEAEATGVEEVEEEKTDDGETIQRRTENSDQGGSDPEQASPAVQGQGAALPAAERAYFEPRLGRNLGEVRVHSGHDAAASAQSLNAQAYTLGDNVVFGPGRYAPGTPSGRSLIAHELAHVIQQSPKSGKSVV